MLTSVLFSSHFNVSTLFRYNLVESIKILLIFDREWLVEPRCMQGNDDCRSLVEQSVILFGEGG